MNELKWIHGGKEMEQWRGFKGKVWKEEVNVRDFIQQNYTPYDGTDGFLEGATQATTVLWEQVMDLNRQEQQAGGVLDMDTKVVSTITSHAAGYLNKELEKSQDFKRKNHSNAACNHLAVSV